MEPPLSLYRSSMPKHTKAEVDTGASLNRRVRQFGWQNVFRTLLAAMFRDASREWTQQLMSLGPVIGLKQFSRLMKGKGFVKRTLP